MITKSKKAYMCYVTFRIYHVVGILVFFLFSITVHSGIDLAEASSKVNIYRAGDQSGHYLQWNGKPILLIGDSVTQGWMELGLNFSQEKYLYELAARGINILMIWSYIGTNAERQKKDPRIGYDAPEVWPWQGSPDKKTFDLTKFNQAYFERLKDLVAYAEKMKIVVLIAVHDGGIKWRFDHHPFHSKLGNGPLTDGNQYVVLSNYKREMQSVFKSAWSWQQKNQYFQERFCDKLIKELNPYSNVIYELFNEGNQYNQQLRKQHEQHFLTFFRSRCSNLLLTNTDHIAGDKPHNDPKVDIITLHGTWTGRFKDFENGFNKSPPKPYLMSEPVPEYIGGSLVNKFRKLFLRSNEIVNLEKVRRSVWEVTLGGAGWVNQNDSSFGWDQNAKIYSKMNNRDLAYKFAGICARFWNNGTINFANMKPIGKLSSTGICLAKEGSEYIIYAPTGGKFSVDLSRADGIFDSKWYNPRTGETVPEKSTLGGFRTFIAPDGNDWVFHIKNIGNSSKLIKQNHRS
jgi:hypothetical protein